MGIAKKIYKASSVYLGFRNRRNAKMREQLADCEFSVFSNNCLGGVFLHDAGKRFNSPFVNLSMKADSFMAIIENPREYLTPKFNFLKNTGRDFPIGEYKDATVYFVHYKEEKTAEEKWIERAKRIIWDDIYIIATGHDGMETPEYMERFDRLPYKNKVMFTQHSWEQYPWAKQVKLLENKDKMPPLPQFASLNGKRLYDTAFDLARWIAECEGKNTAPKSGSDG